MSDAELIHLGIFGCVIHWIPRHQFLCLLIMHSFIISSFIRQLIDVDPNYALTVEDILRVVGNEFLDLR